MPDARPSNNYASTEGRPIRVWNGKSATSPCVVCDSCSFSQFRLLGAATLIFGMQAVVSFDVKGSTDLKARATHGHRSVAEDPLWKITETLNRLVQRSEGSVGRLVGTAGDEAILVWSGEPPRVATG